jgi:Domain of unknown function (DUF4160)
VATAAGRTTGTLASDILGGRVVWAVGEQITQLRRGPLGWSGVELDSTLPSTLSYTPGAVRRGAADNPSVPRISAFYGIVVTMYFRDHPPPHFHARYGDDVAEIAIDTLELIDG